MSTDSDSVELDVTDGVATITLNEPDRRTALSSELSAGLRAALEEIEASEASCVVIQGAGGAFSAGGDVERMLEGLSGDQPLNERVRALDRSSRETMARLYHFPLPTIAKIDGPAVGAGANLAMACDVGVATEDAVFGFVFREVGLGLDAGTSYLLPRIVGANVAKELVFTGEIVDADSALELGLVNSVHPSDEIDARVADLARRIADGPDVALRHAKRLLNEGFEKSIERAMTDEAVAQGIVFQTDDHREGVEAFTEGREPEFEGR